jgi:hypothetical protein
MWAAGKDLYRPPVGSLPLARPPRITFARSLSQNFDGIPTGQSRFASNARNGQRAVCQKRKRFAPQ